MNRIEKNVEIGKGKDITLERKVMVDDEVIVKGEGDSFLYAFLYGLYAHFLKHDPDFILRPDSNAPTPDAYFHMTRFGGRSDYTPRVRKGSFADSGRESDVWREIGSISTNPTVLNTPENTVFNRLDGSDLSNAGGIRAVKVQGVTGGNAANINGRHEDISANDGGVTLNQVSADGSEDASNAYLAHIFGSDLVHKHGQEFDSQDHFPYLSLAELVIGRGGAANDIDRSLMEDLIIASGAGDIPGTVQYNAQTINEPNVNLAQQRSTIKITREVQNNSGAEIPVNEIGIITDRSQADFANMHATTVIARDTLSTSIPDGSTISFTYKLRTKSNADGGVMTNFNEILYRQLDFASRAIRDINNQEQTAGELKENKGSDNVHTQYSILQPRAGIQQAGETRVNVGRGTTAVDEANFDLDDRIPMGVSAGELLSLGTNVGQMQVDQQNDEAFFPVTTIYENVSGSDIDINEIGLMVNTPGTGFSNPAMIFRDLLSQTETIPDGERAAVTYNVKIGL